MGSIITLAVGGLEIDWGKNSYFTNHSRLFLRDDVKPEIYYYADNVQEVQPAFSRPLRKVLSRLELLGYSIANCRRLYEEVAPAVPDYYPDPENKLRHAGAHHGTVDVTQIGMGEESEDYDLGEYAANVIMADPEFTKTETDVASLTRHDGCCSST